MDFKQSYFQNPSLRYIQEHYESEYLERFNRTVKGWNQLIRNFMSRSMGVTLSDGENARFQISISIQPAPDENFLDLIERNFPDLNFEEFYRLSCLVEEGEASQRFFKDEDAARQLSRSLEYARYRLRNFDIDYITKNLFRFLQPNNPDIFGCYFITENKVVLYVAPCVLFCQLHGLDLDSFIVMILAHELAHGYNHIGRDKDGNFWEDFGYTDDFLAEGLAQYYTEAFINKYSYKQIRLPDVFEKTLRYQPDPYSVHKSWNASFEQVFAAFIESRRNRFTAYSDFESNLIQSKKRIKE